jgi:curved DNA-binding protein CbpA
MASPTPSHYERLGVAPDAELPELRAAFRALSKRYHPDTTSLPGAEAEEAFRQLRQAYSVLSDPQARAAYDVRLRQPASPPIVLNTPPARPPAVVAAPRPASVRRSLSGGEWFALLLLALAMAFSLLLGIGVAWARGTELVRQPSWWPEVPAPAATAPAATAPSARELLP